MKFFFAIFLLFAFQVSGRTSEPASKVVVPQDSVGSFDGANRLYEQQEFEKAAKAYESLLQRGKVSSELLFNLGNAWYKAGRTGQAILNYRKAVLLSPRDPDVRANLHFAREQSGLGAPPKANLLEMVVSRISVNEWGGLLLGYVWIGLALLTAWTARQTWRPTLRPYLVVTALSGVSVAIALLAWWHAHRWTDRYIVDLPATGPRVVQAKFGPLEESQSAFPLKDGVEVLGIGSKGDWIQVTDNGQRTGWVVRSTLAPIRLKP